MEEKFFEIYCIQDGDYPNEADHCYNTFCVADSSQLHKSGLRLPCLH